MVAAAPPLLRSLSCDGTHRTAPPPPAPTKSESAPFSIAALPAPEPAAPAPLVQEVPPSPCHESSLRLDSLKPCMPAGKSWADQVEEDEEEDRLAALQASALAPLLKVAPSHAPRTPAPRTAAPSASPGVRASAPSAAPATQRLPAVSAAHSWVRPGFREQPASVCKAGLHGRPPLARTASTTVRTHQGIASTAAAAPSCPRPAAQPFQLSPELSWLVKAPAAEWLSYFGIRKVSWADQVDEDEAAGELEGAQAGQFQVGKKRIALMDESPTGSWASSSSGGCR